MKIARESDLARQDAALRQGCAKEGTGNGNQ